jgi:Membrane protein implicated in regulation of membrane protease activity
MNLVSFMPYIWITLAVFSLIIEAASLYYTAICFLPAAIAAIALAFLNYPIYTQALVFGIISLTLLLIRFALLRNVLDSKKITPDNLVGNQALVIEIINEAANTGKIKIKNKIYKAEAADNKFVYETGVMVTISGYRENDETFLCE